MNRCVTVDNVTIEYLLKSERMDSGKFYSISISMTSNGEVSSYTLTDIARSEENALRLLGLLADNAVCPSSAPYVIDSLADEMTFC